MLQFHRRHAPPLQFGIGPASHATFVASAFFSGLPRYPAHADSCESQLPQARSGRLSLSIPITGHQFPKAIILYHIPRLTATPRTCHHPVFMRWHTLNFIVNPILSDGWRGRPILSPSRHLRQQTPQQRDRRLYPSPFPKVRCARTKSCPLPSRLPC